MEVSWCGSLGMDAERAPLGHGWPVGACPHHGAGTKEPLRSRGRTSARMVLVTFVETKVTRPSGRNQTQQRQNAVVATRFKPQHLGSSKL